MKMAEDMPPAGPPVAHASFVIVRYAPRCVSADYEIKRDWIQQKPRRPAPDMQGDPRNQPQRGGRSPFRQSCPTMRVQNFSGHHLFWPAVFWPQIAPAKKCG